MIRNTVQIALLLLGTVLGWWMLTTGRLSTEGAQWALIAKLVVGMSVVGLVVRLVPSMRSAASRPFDAIQKPTTQTRVLTFLFITSIATLYFCLHANWVQRTRFPRIHDEHAYLLQARMLADFRLWMPAHEMADFFETFHVHVKPVYTSIYFPGTALMYVPGMWIGWPHWFTSALICGLACGLIYLAATEMFGGVYGWVGALILVSSEVIRASSTSALSQVPMMVTMMVTLIAWIRWRRSQSVASAVVMGVALGLGLITRPVDAIAMGIVLLASTVPEIVKSPRAMVRPILLATAGAIPFITLQLALNLGTTGRLLYSPYQMYVDLYQPGTGLGFAGRDESMRPQTTLQQKIDLYDGWIKSRMELHTPARAIDTAVILRFPYAIGATLGVFVLVPLWTLGWFGLSDRRCWPVILYPVVFIGLYALTPFFALWYAIPTAYAVALCAMAGLFFACEQLQRWLGKGASAMLALLVAVSLVPIIPESRGLPDDEPGSYPSLLKFHENLPILVRKPALVLVWYETGAGVGNDPHCEVVYNYTVSDIDRANIILANDLSERNREIIDYYARTQPERFVYVFDRATRTVSYFGPAGAHPVIPPKQSRLAPAR
jgi:hypothetical protein